MGTNPETSSDEPATSVPRRQGGAENVAQGMDRGAARWPAAVATLAVGVVYALVSSRLRFGPPWLLFAIVAVTNVPLTVALLRGRRDVARPLGLALLTLITLAVIASVALLAARLPGKGVAAPALLRDAALLWVGNILTFALWYWEIDSGGPAKRHRHHVSTDFIFPQMTEGASHTAAWSPTFVDYLFLAFNTSTAFSPTDTMVLSRRAKLLMMTQSLVSLLVIGVLVARAINTL
jgi:hypothetical protein